MLIIIMKLFLETRKDESPTHPSLPPTLEDLITCNSKTKSYLWENQIIKRLLFSATCIVSSYLGTSSFSHVCINFRKNLGSFTLPKDWVSWKNMPPIL